MARRMLSAAKGVLLDWDGSIAIRNRVLPPARELIARHADRVVIVSNNSTELPIDLARILARQDIDFAEDRIFLAGAEAIRKVALEPHAGVYLLGASRMKDYARELGVRLIEREPDIVLLLRDASFTYDKLELAANALRAGARLVVANADLSHPGCNGDVVPETGALLAALLACAGDSDVAQSLIGKPAPLLFERACNHLGVAASDAVMIGDNPLTDGKGAASAGIGSILVGEGHALSLGDLIEPAAA